MMTAIIRGVVREILVEHRDEMRARTDALRVSEELVVPILKRLASILPYEAHVQVRPVWKGWKPRPYETDEGDPGRIWVGVSLWGGRPALRLISLQAYPDGDTMGSIRTGPGSNDFCPRNEEAFVKCSVASRLSDLHDSTDDELLTALMMPVHMGITGR